LTALNFQPSVGSIPKDHSELIIESRMQNQVKSIGLNAQGFAGRSW
jgi:hypothetical protein